MSEVYRAEDFARARFAVRKEGMAISAVAEITAGGWDTPDGILSDRQMSVSGWSPVSAIELAEPIEYTATDFAYAEFAIGPAGHRAARHDGEYTYSWAVTQDDEPYSDAEMAGSGKWRPVNAEEV